MATIISNKKEFKTKRVGTVKITYRLSFNFFNLIFLLENYKL